MNGETTEAKRFLHSALWVVITLVFFTLALMYCRYQQVFTVKQVMVYGNRELNGKHITRSSGIKRGAPMFDIDVAAAVRHLIAEPYIYNAYVSREFPDRINIHVIQRRPNARIDVRETYALDVFATVLPLPQTYAVDSLPLIRGLDPELALEPGEPTLHPDIRRAISFVNYMRNFRAGIREYSHQVTWTEDKGWIIQRDDEHPAVYLGSEELEKRIDILHAFVSKLKEEDRDLRRYRYVSLRFNGQVIVRD